MNHILPFYGLEDDLDDTELIKEACASEGLTDYEFFVEDGEFFAVFSPKVPVIVLDYNLPGTNGQQVLDKARRINPAVRAILISSIITDEMRMRLKDCKDFVIKTLSGKWAIELANKIKYQLQLAEEDARDNKKFRTEINGIIKRND